MTARIICGLLVLTVLLPAAAQEDGAATLAQAQQAREEAIGLLRQARAERFRTEACHLALDRLVEARDLYQNCREAGTRAVQEKITEINALIFWTHKQMPLTVINQRPPLPEEPEAEDPEAAARELYEFAVRYEEQHPDDPFLAEIQFFNVADRYPDSAVARQALRRAIDLHRRAQREEVAVVTPPEEPEEPAEPEEPVAPPAPEEPEEPAVADNPPAEPEPRFVAEYTPPGEAPAESRNREEIPGVLCGSYPAFLEKIAQFAGRRSFASAQTLCQAAREGQEDPGFPGYLEEDQTMINRVAATWQELERRLGDLPRDRAVETAGQEFRVLATSGRQVTYRLGGREVRQAFADLDPVAAFGCYLALNNEGAKHKLGGYLLLYAGEYDAAAVEFERANGMGGQALERARRRLELLSGRSLAGAPVAADEPVEPDRSEAVLNLLVEARRAFAEEDWQLAGARLQTLLDEYGEEEALAGSRAEIARMMARVQEAEEAARSLWRQARRQAEEGENRDAVRNLRQLAAEYGETAFFAEHRTQIIDLTQEMARRLQAQRQENQGEENPEDQRPRWRDRPPGQRPGQRPGGWRPGGKGRH